MSLDQEARLKALGLWPIWRLRASSPAVPGALERDEPVVDTGAATGPAEAGPAEAGLDRGPVPPVEDVPPPPSIAELDWDGLADAVARCTRCPLHASRTQGVLGVGDRQADWLIIGEAPGADEDRLGEPFVGQAGKLLDAMLAAMALKRGQDVYIANVLKSRPPGNRDPQHEEVAACIAYLERQIDLIRPRLILVLGRIAAQSLLNSTDSIARMRGRLHVYRGIPVVVTYHPAYLLRNLPDKAKAWDDLCLARTTMERLKSTQETS